MTEKIRIGNITIGGGEPVAIQSMTTFKAADENSTVRQILALEKAGCDIARFAVSDEEDVAAISRIKKRVHIPLVADIQFDYRLAIASADAGIDKVRINPDNIGSEEKVKAVADAVKANRIPVRVGSNSGSIRKEYLEKYGVSAEALGESALAEVAHLEKYGVNDIVISVKASNVPLCVAAYRYVSCRTGYPLHLGVTEAGTKESGIIKSSIGIGALLLDGIGDTVRVSLSADPVEEIYAAKKILSGVGLRKNCAEVVACPTCGRCMWDAIGMAKKVEDLVKDVEVPLKIAVMGCVVNGVGESADADLGIAGAKGGAALFVKGKVVKTVKKEDVEREFLALLSEITEK